MRNALSALPCLEKGLAAAFAILSGLLAIYPSRPLLCLTHVGTEGDRPRQRSRANIPIPQVA